MSGISEGFHFECEERARVFLLGDAVSIAKRGQKPPSGYYNLEGMLADLIKKGVKVKACGSCLSVRGLDIKDLVEGVEKGSMMGLSEWVRESRAARALCSFFSRTFHLTLIGSMKSALTNIFRFSLSKMKKKGKIFCFTPSALLP